MNNNGDNQGSGLPSGQGMDRRSSHSSNDSNTTNSRSSSRSSQGTRDTSPDTHDTIDLNDDLSVHAIRHGHLRRSYQRLTDFRTQFPDRDPVHSGHTLRTRLLAYMARQRMSNLQVGSPEYNAELNFINQYNQ